jgi:3-hydroxyisobutyrate dehydrogenase
MSAPQKVGFIGLGAMGQPMAARLAGHCDLLVFDISDDRLTAFLDGAPARRAPDVISLARESDVVITMLPNSAAVEQVLLGEAGLLAGLRPGAIMMDMSSSEPASTKRLAETVERAGGVLIDAPVSGGVARAVKGDLAIMTGGSAETLDVVRPLLQRMGGQILPTGEVGSAHAMKALNNLASAAGLLISLEVLAIGAKFGLSPETMVDVLNASSGMNNATQRKLKPFVLSRRFDAGFGLDLMVKDLGIAVDLARQTGAAAPYSALCHELWASAAQMLGRGRDHTEIARFVETLSGAELR